MLNLHLLHIGSLRHPCGVTWAAIAWHLNAPTSPATSSPSPEQANMNLYPAAGRSSSFMAARCSFPPCLWSMDADKGVARRWEGRTDLMYHRLDSVSLGGGGYDEAMYIMSQRLLARPNASSTRSGLPGSDL